MSDIPGTEAISTVMAEILESINAVYEQEGVDLPERQYLFMGEAAHDCEQLTVSFLQLYTGSPGDQAEAVSRCNDPRSVTLQIQLVRCIPNKVSRAEPMPSADSLTESTNRFMTDVWLLLDGAMACPAIEWLGGLGDVSVTEPNGAYQAVQVNLVTAIP